MVLQVQPSFIRCFACSDIHSYPFHLELAWFRSRRTFVVLHRSPRVTFKARCPSPPWRAAAPPSPLRSELSRLKRRCHGFPNHAGQSALRRLRDQCDQVIVPFRPQGDVDRENQAAVRPPANSHKLPISTARARSQRSDRPASTGLSLWRSTRFGAHLPSPRRRRPWE